MLREMLTKKTCDNSTESGFSFSFFCDICGKEWVSPVKQFSGGECSVVENSETLKLLWYTEHSAAFNEAALESHCYHVYCPFCGKWVCKNCFCFEDDEFGGSCKECNGE
uniref:Uncharacterized protein n=1 Tax=uncultured bacterium contig00037 TaxID=1181525 RepID=A0A806KG05_9BACT|nr:hypothetical protein [uncultured bacterium contig00037]